MVLVQVKQEIEVEEKINEEEVKTNSFGVPGFSLEIKKVISISAKAGTKRLPERLVFKMENGRKVTWPVYI